MSEPSESDCNEVLADLDKIAWSVSLEFGLPLANGEACQRMHKVLRAFAAKFTSPPTTPTEAQS